MNGVVSLIDKFGVTFIIISGLIVFVLMIVNQCQQVKHRHIFTMHFCGICGILFFLVPYFLKNFASV